MGRIKEVERACTRCGTRWFVPAEIAKERMPNKLTIAGAKMQRSGAVMTPGIGWLVAGGKKRKVDALEAKRLRILENSRCPGCGSTSFNQGAPGTVLSASGTRVTSASGASATLLDEERDRLRVCQECGWKVPAKPVKCSHCGARR